MTATVFSIEEFSTFDGPNLRTTVFFKGCPLRCEWCHNPEGQRPDKEYVRNKNGCIGCGECLKNANLVAGRTEFTEKSAAACPKGLIRVCGTDYTPRQLADRLNKNADILSDGGGITFSGGEPLLRTDFIVETASLLDPRLTVALQTSGYADNATFEKALGVCDFVPFVTRVPLIPTVTDTPENLTAIAETIAEVGAKRVELLPYNRFAGGKYPTVGRKYSPSFDETVPSSPRTEIFASFGIGTKIL